MDLTTITSIIIAGVSGTISVLVSRYFESKKEKENYSNDIAKLVNNNIVEVMNLKFDQVLREMRYEMNGLRDSINNIKKQADKESGRVECLGKEIKDLDNKLDSVDKRLVKLEAKYSI